MSYRLSPKHMVWEMIVWRSSAPAAPLAWTAARDVKHRESQDLLLSGAAGDVPALHSKTRWAQLLQDPNSSGNDLVCHRHFECDSSHAIHKAGQLVWTNHEAPSIVNKDREENPEDESSHFSYPPASGWNKTPSGISFSLLTTEQSRQLTLSKHLAFQ